MKVRLAEGKCVGHARCAAVAPDMYSLDDNGYLVLDETAVPEEQRHSARRGARACPERAIIVVEDESVS